MIHGLIFRPTIKYGRASWVDANNLMHELEVAGMKFLRMIMFVSYRGQWENRFRNDRRPQDFNVDLV